MAPLRPDDQAYSSAVTLAIVRRTFLCESLQKVYWSYKVLSEEYFRTSCPRKNQSNDWASFSDKVSIHHHIRTEVIFGNLNLLKIFHLARLKWLKSSVHLERLQLCSTCLLSNFKSIYYIFSSEPVRLHETSFDRNHDITQYSAQVYQFKWVTGGCL